MPEKLFSIISQPSVPRDGWLDVVRSQDGLVYEEQDQPGPDGRRESYWQGDTAHLVVPYRIAKLMYRQGCTLRRMIQDAIDRIIADEALLDRMGIGRVTSHDEATQVYIKRKFRELIRETWNWNFGDIMSRMDLIWDYSTNTGRFLEINPVPVGGPESAMAQLRWLLDNMERDPENYRDQFNELAKDLRASWAYAAEKIKAQYGGQVPVVYFLYTGEEETGEDYLNAHFYATCFANAGKQNPDDPDDPGYEYRLMKLQDVGYDSEAGFYQPIPGTDMGVPIQVAYLLYPWHWLLEAKFGPHWLERYGTGPGKTLVLQPPWIDVLDNQAINVVLWEMFQNDPELKQLLLPSYFQGEQPPHLLEYVVKPLTGHEGGGKVYVRGGMPVESVGGDYDDTWGTIVQAYQKQPVVQVGGSDMRLVHSLWFAGTDEAENFAPSCLMFRATRRGPGGSGRITNRDSFFLPHVINDGPENLFEGV